MKKKKPTQTTLPKLPPEEFEKARNWAQDSTAEPNFVRNVILALESAKSSGSELAAKRAVEALARAMGIIPSSEKATPSKQKKEPAPAIDNEIAQLLSHQEKLKELLRYTSRKLNQVQNAIANGMKRRETEPSSALKPTGSTESVLAGGPTENQGTEENSRLPEEEARNQMGNKAIETKVQRVKTDLVFDHRTKTLNGVKIYDPETGKTLAMDTSLLGPKGKRITWRALANITVLVFGMAMPASRIEKLFGKKGFSRSNISDYCAYVADRLLPVYIAMAEAIGKCKVIMGDDCVSRVTDLTRYFRDLKIWKAAIQKAQDEQAFLAAHPKPKAPWEGLSNQSLTFQLQDALDFPFAHIKSNGDKVTKTRLHTSLLSGETITGDPTTRIVFYRSHLGSVGDLMSRILLGRKPSDGPVVFLGDLSPSNHVSDPNIQKRVAVSYVGCCSHARRPFKRYFDHDPEDCAVALDLFRAIYHIEEIILGASDQLKLSIRAEQGMWCWNELKSLCLEMQKKWSPSTALGEGILYILSNFESLTAYCNDIRLPPSNDLSERHLRYEKLMDRSSFGRETVEGRARYDIIRSFWQTCVSAQIDPTYALIDILITPPGKVAENPTQFIPQNILKRHKADPQRVEQIDQVLHTKDFTSLVSYKLHDPGMPLDDEE